MRRALSLAGAVLLLAACQPSFEVYDLRCEGLVEPLGIDSANPHFSWKIRSDQPMEQAAYEIEVGPDLWQSGKVESPDQVMVPYEGLPLYSRQQAWWRVRVWDAAGKASAWSPKQRFGIGVLDGLKGDFIGAVPGEGRQPVFRKVFKAYSGYPPAQYFLRLKMERAKDYLQSTSFSCKEISFRLGFDSASYFNKMFRLSQGMTPMEYREKPPEDCSDG